MFVIMMSSMVIFMPSVITMRYDELMYLCWKIILLLVSLVLVYLLMILSFKFFLLMMI